MATITKPNTFASGATILAAEHNANFNTIYDEFNGNIDNANIKASAAIVDTKLAQITTASKVSGAAITSLSSIPSGAGVIPNVNLLNVTWTNYGSTSTKSGWSSFTTQLIYYKRFGNTVFVNFQIEGTSNATNATFTLPYTSTNDVETEVFVQGSDNGVALTAPSRLQLPVNSSTATAYASVGSATWTNSGTKIINGQFWYESA